MRLSSLVCICAVVCLGMAVGCAQRAASSDAEVLGGKGVPSKWTMENRRVRVSTPDGEVDRQVTYYRNSIGMELVRIPAGEFLMGSPDNDTSAERDDREHPQHRVIIPRPFFMGACGAVVRGQYTFLLTAWGRGG